MKGLTKRQREVLDFIEHFIEQRRFSPSYREIARHFGFSSVASVHKHVHALKRKGALGESQEDSSIATVTTSTPPTNTQEESSIKELPFIGSVTIGGYVDTFSQTANIPVPEAMIRSESQSYVLEMQGEELDQEGMRAGDLIVVCAGVPANSGDTVLATCHGRETIIGRYYSEGPYARLESLSLMEREPKVIHHENLSILGVLTGLLRLY